MTVRGYTRVSSYNQLDGFSLAAQRAKCEAWAAYQGLGEVVVYEDAAISGRHDDRPSLTALLLDLRPGDIVVTYALSRLARGGAVQLLGIVRDIRERGARVVFLSESIDTDTPTGRLMLTILAALAELELEQTRERTDMGRTQAALEGFFPGGGHVLPLGYTTDQDGRIVAEPLEADTVRFIFAQGQAPYHRTAALLNTAGVPSKRGGEWKVSQVRRAVLFETYHTGQYVFRASTRPEDVDQHVVIPAPVLVTPEVWQAAQRGRALNHQHRKPDVYPLTGHIRCKCGSRINGRHRKPAKAHWASRLLYCCFDHVRKSPLCPAWGQRIPEYRAETLHQAARETLAALLTNPADPAFLALAYGAAPVTDRHAEERRGIQRKIDALLDLYLEGVVDRATFERRQQVLKAQLEQLRPEPPTPPLAMPARPELARAVLEATNEELAELLDLLEVEMVMLDKEHLHITSYRPLNV